LVDDGFVVVGGGKKRYAGPNWEGWHVELELGRSCGQTLVAHVTNSTTIQWHGGAMLFKLVIVVAVAFRAVVCCLLSVVLLSVDVVAC
jgi:hypothetical protein